MRPVFESRCGVASSLLQWELKVLPWWSQQNHIIFKRQRPDPEISIPHPSPPCLHMTQGNPAESSAYRKHLKKYQVHDFWAFMEKKSFHSNFHERFSSLRVFFWTQSRPWHLNARPSCSSPALLFKALMKSSTQVSVKSRLLRGILSQNCSSLRKRFSQFSSYRNMQRLFFLRHKHLGQEQAKINSIKEKFHPQFCNITTFHSFLLRQRLQNVD